MTRRELLKLIAAAGVGTRLPAAEPAAAGGVFTLGERGGRWWLMTPEGRPFFSIGLNHIDPSPLRFTSNGDLWQRKYGNSMQRWLQEAVGPDLRAWGFNCVGWAQEVVTRGETNHRHSRAFTLEEYQWLGLPYCHLLPFADFHQWDVEVKHPRFDAPDWIDWCDYVAREHCARMRDDPLLIGYFYIDCPTWIHTRPGNEWKGPLFDPARLQSDAGRRELFDLATAYYRTTHAAIRRYDSRHLIFGDRYEAGQPIAAEVIQAALPYVDVLSFQHFATPEKVEPNLRHWHVETGKPVLLADHAAVIRAPDGSSQHDGAGYAQMLRTLREIPGCIGYHLCGAYLRNETRKRALRDAAEQPDDAALAMMTQANREAAEWMLSVE